MIEKPAVALLGQLGWETTNLRRTRDLLLPRLVSGEVDVSGVGVEGG